VSGKQIKLFLVDGTPGGLTTAEITNWTGHVLTASRSDVAELLRRDEASRTGVYLLLGEDSDASGGTQCYVGETDSIADRIKQHLRDKDWWDGRRHHVQDENLTKSHVRYLESRLISLAHQAARVTLSNGTAPPQTRLPRLTAPTWTTSSASCRSCCRSSVSTPSAPAQHRRCPTAPHRRRFPGVLPRQQAHRHRCESPGDRR
jgi:hypothetical protein